MVGWAANSSNKVQLHIRRYSTDGSLDTGFGSSGMYAYPGGGQYNATYAATWHEQERVVVAGTTGTWTSDASIAAWRISADGTGVDTSFAGDGKYTTTLSSQREFGNAVAVDATGRIYVAGATKASGSEYLMVVYRLLSDGTLDTSYGGGNGYFTHSGNPALSGYEMANAIVVAPDGGLYVTGLGNADGSGYDQYVWKLDPDGNLDTSFGGAGFVSEACDVCNGLDIAIDHLGRIVVVGSLEDSMAIWRYNPDGTPDVTFSENGVFTHKSTIAVGVRHSPSILRIVSLSPALTTPRMEASTVILQCGS